MCVCRWKKAMEAVHRANLLLLLADFAGVQSAVPVIVARYKVHGLVLYRHVLHELPICPLKIV